MKTKTITIGILLGVLLIGVVSAGLLDYFGKITGSVEVEGPVFYLDGQIDDGVYHKLLTNEIPNPEDEIEINWSDGHRIVFRTEPLNVDGFYKAKFDIHIWIKTNNASGNLIQLNMMRINEDKTEDIICTNSELINSSIKTHKEISCTSDGEILMKLEDRFGLEIKGLETSESDIFWMSPGAKYTSGGNPVYNRIEISAI